MAFQNAREYYYENRYEVLNYLENNPSDPEYENAKTIIKQILMEDYSLDDELFTIKM